MNKTIYFFEPIGQHSGMFEYDSQTCKSIRNQGFSVTWVTSDSGNKDVDGVNIWRPFVDIFSGSNKLLRGLNYFIGWVKLFFRLLLKKNNNALHGNFLILPIVDVVFYALCCLFKIKVVYSVHDVVPYGAGRLTNKILNYFYKLPIHFVAHSEFTKKELSRLFDVDSSRCIVIPHSSYVNTPISSEESVLSLRNKIGVDSTVSKIILFFGVIRKAKGLRYLVLAMPDVIRRNPNVVLVIAGKSQDDSIDECREIIEREGISKNIILINERISEEDMSAFYQMCDLVVLPYLEVYQSGVFFMSSAYSKACIATNVGGFSEVITHKDNGYLVEPSNVKSLVAGVNELLDDSELLNSISINARQSAIDSSDWNVTAEKYALTYKD